MSQIGMARDNWENTGSTYTYSSQASTRNKDTYFQYVISAVVNYWMVRASYFAEALGQTNGAFPDADQKFNKAYVGTMPWSYGGVCHDVFSCWELDLTLGLSLFRVDLEA